MIEYVSLVNGDGIFGYVDINKNAGIMTIKDALSVSLNTTASSARGMLLLKYSPYTSEDYININMEHVLFHKELSEPMKKYYQASFDNIRREIEPYINKEIERATNALISNHIIQDTVNTPSFNEPSHEEQLDLLDIPLTKH